MFFKKKIQSQNNDEDRICALCEFSVMSDGKLLCKGKKAVDDTHVCRKYIFDPSKKKFRHQAFSGISDEIEFPPIT